MVQLRRPSASAELRRYSDAPAYGRAVKEPDLSWLDALPDDEKTRLDPRFLRRAYRRGDSVTLQGDPSANIFVLDGGFAAVRVSTEHGESLTVTVLGPGATFGELAGLTPGEMRTATVVALDEVKVRVLPYTVFDELRRRVPAIDREIAQMFAARVDDLSRRLAEMTYETVQRRCARRLTELADLMAVPGARSASLPITQDDLAGLVGATRPPSIRSSG